MRRRINATFKNGQTATYTTDVYRLLVTDPDVLRVTDAETGELMYSAETEEK